MRIFELEYSAIVDSTMDQLDLEQFELGSPDGIRSPRLLLLMDRSGLVIKSNIFNIDTLTTIPNGAVAELMESIQSDRVEDSDCLIYSVNSPSCRLDSQVKIEHRFCYRDTADIECRYMNRVELVSSNRRTINAIESRYPNAEKLSDVVTVDRECPDIYTLNILDEINAVAFCTDRCETVSE